MAQRVYKDPRELGDWLDKQTPKIRPHYGRPSPYQRLEKEWDNSYGAKQKGIEFNPFDDYHRAVGNWNNYFTHHDGEDPSLKGALEWLEKNKSILENPDPKEWVATSYDENFYNQFPQEVHDAFNNLNTPEEEVEFAKGYTKNGPYSPRQMIRYLTGRKNLFTDPYEDRVRYINKILNLWRNL